jgi:2-oxoglutarate dehydrogenase E2 component (dihydrolipoamide succinyltransferase)
VRTGSSKPSWSPGRSVIASRMSRLCKSPETERDDEAEDKEKGGGEAAEVKPGPAIRVVGTAAAAAAPPSPPPAPEPPPSADREEEVVPMSILRRTMVRRFVEAQRTMAMLTTFNEVDMSAVQALRQEHGEAFEKRYHVRLGLMSFFVKAAIDALKRFPQLNAEIRGTDIVYRNYFDIGVAISCERGLVVPVLRHAERLSFAELEQATGDFAQRACDAKLKPSDLEGGTFTITNGGVFGSLLSTPIINPPQSGILGLHAIQERPVAVAGQVVVRPMMYVALTYDHRLVDGREAVLFLRRLKETVESPARLLVEI